MTAVDVGLRVNGQPRSAVTEARVSLLDFLRDDLGLTGTHAGCEQGACGACSVLVDGEVVRSCLVLAVACAGREVTTIEGLGSPDGLHPLQQAMVEHHGLQCGFCTPGMVLAAVDLLARDPDPDERRVRESLAGNICRCTGYAGIVAAVVDAARTFSKAGNLRTKDTPCPL